MQRGMCLGVWGAGVAAECSCARNGEKAAGAHADGAETVRASAETVLRRLAPWKSAVAVDRTRRCLIVDGQPFMAIGLVFGVWPHTPLADVDEAICQVELEVLQQVLGAPVEFRSRCRDGHSCCEFQVMDRPLEMAGRAGAAAVTGQTLESSGGD